jgi:hypothetical protein
MQVVQVGAEGRLVGTHIEIAWGKARRQVLADGRRLRHENRAVEQDRHGAQGIDLQVGPGQCARRERHHLQLVCNPDLLEHPQGTKRTRAHAVVRDDHGFRCSEMAGLDPASCTVGDEVSQARRSNQPGIAAMDVRGTVALAQH